MPNIMALIVHGLDVICRKIFMFTKIIKFVSILLSMAVQGNAEQAGRYRKRTRLLSRKRKM